MAKKPKYGKTRFPKKAGSREMTMAECMKRMKKMGKSMEQAHKVCETQMG